MGRGREEGDHKDTNEGMDRKISEEVRRGGKE